MIEIARRLLETQFTPALLNAQITALNTRYGSTCPQVDASSGVADLWAVSVMDMQRPSYGYRVGLPNRATARLKTQGLNRMTLPVTIIWASAESDKLTVAKQIGVALQAAIYVLEAIEGQTLPGVSPPAGCVLIGDYAGSPLGSGMDAEAVTIDSAAGGPTLGFQLRTDFTLDDVRS